MAQDKAIDTAQICGTSDVEIEKWYAEDGDDDDKWVATVPLPQPSQLIAESDRALAPARTAFEEAIRFFNMNLTADPHKKIWLDSVADLDDVEQAVLKAKEGYDTRKGSSKARTWLSRFAKRVKFYSGIMDVLVEHHPEYVSLAWGAMKFLFVVCKLWKGDPCERLTRT